MAASALFPLQLDLFKTHKIGYTIQLCRFAGSAGDSASYLSYLAFDANFSYFRMLLWVLHNVPVEGNLYKIVGTLVVFHTAWVTLTPLIFIACKWLIIGEYRKGRYPIRGSAMFCVSSLAVEVGETLNMYYRMLGAKIG